MSYSRLKILDRGDNIMLRMVSHDEVLHNTGAMIDTKAPGFELPFQFEMDVGEYGYDQYDPDFEGDVVVPPLEERLVDYYGNVCVMSLKLVEVLLNAGVDNLQIFPAYITDAGTGERVKQDYRFVNIVGMISCADVKASESSPLGGTYYFHELVIDESKARGLLLFRLAESPSEVVVHERVAAAIDKAILRGLRLERLGSKTA